MAEGFAGDSGTQAAPYVVTSAAQLKTVQDNLDAHYRLGGNIELKGEAWTPIGTETNPFNRTLDGDGHTVANLSVSMKSSCSGLFAAIGAGGAVKNLRLGNPSVVSEPLSSRSAGTPAGGG